MAKKEEWSGFAIAGFVLSLVFGFGILSLVFSSLGLYETKDNKKKGKELSIAGIVISVFSLIEIGRAHV